MVSTELRLHLAKLAKEHTGIPITYMDGIGAPKIGNDYATLELLREGSVIRLIVMTSENFYEALGTAIRETMPGSAGRKLS